jgi:hypothetical protein
MNTAKKIETPHTVEETIYNMLIENTGVHMLDSGGAAGRMWQHNQVKSLADFQNEPKVAFEVTDFYQDWQNKKGKRYTVNYTISAFHYLTEAGFELDEYCQDFNGLPCKELDETEHFNIYGLSPEQRQYLDTVEAQQESKAWNSYNGEDALSQVLQGAYVKINDADYVILQIHGGADVRGGYTDPKMFKMHKDACGYLPMQDVDGDIDGKPVSNRDSFPRLTWENTDTGCSAGDIELKRKPKAVNLYLSTSY